MVSSECAWSTYHYPDYAVTPDSLEKLIWIDRGYAEWGFADHFCTRRLWDATEEKRPIMGSIVSSYADALVLTNEESRMGP